MIKMQTNTDSTVWFQKGSVFQQGNLQGSVEKLPSQIYCYHHDPRSGSSLEIISKTFDLPEKIYGLQDKFLDRCIKSWENSQGNMGLLLNGYKGTGKTIFAKMLCNNLKMPTIFVTEKFDEFPEYISSIEQDVIIFIDEYEKLYQNSTDLLTLMDGLLTNKHRRLFVLTTNQLNVNQYLLSRPSRIRYVKSFGFLTYDDIMNIVDDLCGHKDETFKEKVICGLGKVESLTVDIALKFIEEALIHLDYTADELVESFNIEVKISMNVEYTIQSVQDPSFLYKGLITTDRETADDIHRFYNLGRRGGHRSADNYVNRLLFDNLPQYIEDGYIECVDILVTGTRVFKHFYDNSHVEYFPNTETFTVEVISSVNTTGYLKPSSKEDGDNDNTFKKTKISQLDSII